MRSLFFVYVVVRLSAVLGMETCADMYKIAFKKGGGKAKPDKVGGLFKEYCMKNMKMSSGKPMDELCAPMVKKVDEKMSWVPPGTDVTPEVVCKSVDKIKELFPDYAATAQKSAAEVDADKAAQQAFVDKAKELKSTLAKEMKETLQKWNAQLRSDLAAMVKEKTEKVLGEMVVPKANEKLYAMIADATDLGVKGVETRLVQKLDDAMGSWASAARKESSAQKAEL